MVFGITATVSLHAKYPTGKYCGISHRERLFSVHVRSSETLTFCQDGEKCVNFEYRIEADRDNGENFHMVVINDGRVDPKAIDWLTYDSKKNQIRIGGDVALHQEQCHTHRHLAASSSLLLPTDDDTPIRLPALNIEKGSVVTAGCSHAGDFASQFHIAFSSLVSGSCVFSGQPYHCAVQRFSRDYLVPQNNATGVPNCDGCPDGMTLLYDHCKNHPEVRKCVCACVRQDETRYI